MFVSAHYLLDIVTNIWYGTLNKYKKIKPVVGKICSKISLCFADTVYNKVLEVFRFVTGSFHRHAQFVRESNCYGDNNEICEHS